MTVRRIALASGLLMIAVLSAGCFRPLPLEEFTTGTPLAIDDLRATRFVAGQRDRAQTLRAMRGSARVVLEGEGFKLNRPQRIAIARPGKLRFEVLGLFDVLAAMLVTDGRQFGFYDASTGDIQRGLMTRQLLWELTMLDLDAQEVVALLLATPIPGAELTRSAVWLEPDAGLTIGYSRAGIGAESPCGAVENGHGDGESSCVGTAAGLEGGGELFRFDAQGRLTEMRSLELGWVTRYHVSFEEYADLEVAERVHHYPMRITVRSPQLGAMARFEWKRVMLADDLPDQLFTIPLRSGVEG